MKTHDFDFDLPESLIAQSPTPERGQSRLLVLNRGTGSREHRMVSELPMLLKKGTLLVFNNSRVRKARLFGVSINTGAKAEFLLIKKFDDLSWQVLAKRSKRKKSGTCYVFDDGTKAILSQAARTREDPGPGTSSGEELLLCFDHPIDDDWLDRFGHVPLPPYIRREDTQADSKRYQTIFASQIGSAAAPTAGLHFTEKLLADLDNAGMEKVFITLHVGLGTFLPVRTENIEDHVMHEETFYIGKEEAAKIEKAKKEKRNILAVGTTSLRALESVWQDGFLEAQRSHGAGKPEAKMAYRVKGLTSIFIYPGFKFKVVDQLFTNFHTPMSSLLMLVSAFTGEKSAPGRNSNIPGRDLILDTYHEAIKEGYRFFSYGDAMLIQ